MLIKYLCLQRASLSGRFFNNSHDLPGHINDDPNRVPKFLTLRLNLGRVRVGASERGGEQRGRKFHLADGAAVTERLQDHHRHRPQRNGLPHPRGRKEDDQAAERSNLAFIQLLLFRPESLTSKWLNHCHE